MAVLGECQETEGEVGGVIQALTFAIEEVGFFDFGWRGHVGSVGLE